MVGEKKLLEEGKEDQNDDFQSNMNSGIRKVKRNFAAHWSFTVAEIGNLECLKQVEHTKLYFALSSGSTCLPFHFSL
jgi:hypothetical protein